MTNYYTVSEYAEITGKDVGNIRKLLIKGDIQGEKLGRQWVIPKDTVYPKDRRVKSGNYHNWRQKNAFSKNNPVIMHALVEMSSKFRKIYGSAIEMVVLYGSYARGEQTKESDVDIAVFLNSNTNETMHDQMIDVVVDYELELELTLSVVPIEYEQYMQWRKTLPFYKNIDKEGIPLWKAV